MTGDTPAQRVHQSSTAGGGGPPPLRDLYRLQGSPPEAPDPGTHQVSSAHPGFSSSQTQDQLGPGLPGYDQVVDNSVQLPNLSFHAVVPGETLDPTDPPPALNPGSVKVPRHPVISPFKVGLSLPGPERPVPNVWQPGLHLPPPAGESCNPPPDPQALNPDLQRPDEDLRVSGSADGGPQAQQWYDPPFPPPPPYSPGQTRDPDPPTETTPAAPQSHVDPLRPGGPDLRSPGWGQNLDPPGSKVQSVRVKPASRFSAAHPLRQRPFIWPLDSGPRESSNLDPHRPREGTPVHTADPDQSSPTHLTQDQQTHLHSTVLQPEQDLFPPAAGAGPGPRLVQAAGRVGTWDLGPGPPGPGALSPPKPPCSSPPSGSRVQGRPTSSRTLTTRPSSGPGALPDPQGSAGSAVTGHFLSGCSRPSGASVHRGIIRGTRRRANANVTELTAWLTHVTSSAQVG